MNPLLSALTGKTGGNSIMMKAVFAAVRGEDPVAFMKGLAQSNPQLQGLNLDDLAGTANALAEKKGANIDQLTQQIKQQVSNLM